MHLKDVADSERVELNVSKLMNQIEIIRIIEWIFMENICSKC